MRAFVLLSFLICSKISISQIDTIRIDIEDMSINLKTSMCLLFGSCSNYSYPVSSEWTKADSLFIANSDTVYLYLMDQGVLHLEGIKLPESEMQGVIRFYDNNQELFKIEIWEEYYLHHGNVWASWTDAPEWRVQMIYKNGELTKETTRSIIHTDKLGFARKTETNLYRKGVKQKTKTKYQQF